MWTTWMRQQRGKQTKPTSKTPERRFLIEQLEDRLTPSWAGIPPTTIVPPTNAVGVTLNAQRDAQGTAAITNNEIDYFTFVAPASGSYRLEAQTPSSRLDTVLGVFNANGGRIAYNDDISTSNLDSRVTVTLNAGTRYYFGITNYTGTAGGSYTWVVDGPAPTTTTDDRFENNDSRAQAANLGTLTSLRRETNLIMADGQDWFSFTMNGTGTSAHYVSIAFQHAQGDLDLAVFNSAGTRVGLSQGVTNSERIALTNFAPGTYTVQVYGYAGATNPNYTLEINPATAVAPTVDLLGALVNAPTSGQLGGAITVQAAVRNNGNTTSGAFQVQFYLSRDGLGSSDDVALNLVGGATSFNHGGVAANSQGASFNVQLQLPTNLPSGWTGSNFFIVMRTDSANQIVESNENNNFGQVGAGFDSDSIALTAQPPTGAFQITLNITGMTANQISIFQQAAARWARIITGDLPDATFNGVVVDDVLIDASGVAIDGAGGILGQAGPDRLRSGSLLPIHGIMQFDTADLAQLENNGTLLAVILHEMGHVLGIGTIWNSLGLLSGRGTSNPLFTGVQATAEYNRLFGRNETGVPVENTGGSGTRDSHWRESVFSNELMTGFLGPGLVNPISRMTIASLADLGYQVNLNAADPYVPPNTSSFVGGTTNGNGSALVDLGDHDHDHEFFADDHDHDHDHDGHSHDIDFAEALPRKPDPIALGTKSGSSNTGINRGGNLGTGRDTQLLTRDLLLAQFGLSNNDGRLNLAREGLSSSNRLTVNNVNANAADQLFTTFNTVSTENTNDNSHAETLERHGDSDVVSSEESQADSELEQALPTDPAGATDSTATEAPTTDQPSEESATTVDQKSFRELLEEWLLPLST